MSRGWQIFFAGIIVELIMLWFLMSDPEVFALLSTIAGVSILVYSAFGDSHENVNLVVEV